MASRRSTTTRRGIPRAPPADSAERALLASYEAGEWVPATKQAVRRRAVMKAAEAALKDQRLNIRLSSPVLAELRRRAAEEGLPYQTLISSVLHKYVTGLLVERPR